MQYEIDGCLLKDVEDKEQVVKDILFHTFHESIAAQNITRAMGAYDQDNKLCGYFLTCDYLGIKSFHGFKFSKGQLNIQFKMASKYLEIEKLKYSGYKNKETKVFLRALGFKEILHINGITIAKRQ